MALPPSLSLFPSQGPSPSSPFTWFRVTLSPETDQVPTPERKHSLQTALIPRSAAGEAVCVQEMAAPRSERYCVGGVASGIQDRAAGHRHQLMCEIAGGGRRGLRGLADRGFCNLEPWKGVRTAGWEWAAVWP